jgi:hypothetical protein
LRQAVDAIPVRQAVVPDFLCIGAQKAGTTWLHENLRLQPEIFLPPVKELHFLDHPPPSILKRLFSGASHHRLARQNFHRTLMRWFRRSASWDEARLSFQIAFAHRDWDWYRGLFQSSGGRVCGEVCPGYARLAPEVVARLAEAAPKLKIVYLLRDPIDRAWSSVAMHFRKSRGELITGKNDRQIVERLMGPKSFAHCTYRKNIETWLKFFPPEQVYFGFFERIVEEPEAYLRDILTFLGISGPVVSAGSDRPVNSGKGEKINFQIERQIAELLLTEAEYLDSRFANGYTDKWLRHAQSVLSRQDSRNRQSLDANGGAIR